MILHYTIIVTGKVQGVYYRKSTLQKATSLKIKGTVQNMPDKSVYIEAEGAKEQLLTLIEWCKKGPLFANVTSVKFDEGELKDFKTFEILR